MIITSEMIFVVFSTFVVKPFLRNKIDPMPLMVDKKVQLNLKFACVIFFR
jgi:hypothetical protein